MVKLDMLGKIIFVLTIFLAFIVLLPGCVSSQQSQKHINNSIAISPTTAAPNTSLPSISTFITPASSATASESQPLDPGPTILPPISSNASTPLPILQPDDIRTFAIQIRHFRI
jgi:hypothetical protein